MKYIKSYNEHQINENMKNWISSFLLMVNFGLVPLSVKASDVNTQKKFIESQPQDKVDAAKFIDYINKVNGGQYQITSLWEDFISENPNTKSSLNDVEKYITKDGKMYHFDKKYQVQNFKNVDINTFTPTNYLTDMGGFIEDSKEPEINNAIYNYANDTYVEICIITIPKLEENITIDDYAQTQFNRIGVGKSVSNNGILIVVSMEDRKWRIHTGYGVEGLLPDIECNHIGQNIIVNHFKQKDYYGGLMGALDEIRSIIYKNPRDIERFKKEIEEQYKSQQNENLKLLGEILLVLAIMTTLSILFYKRWKNRKEMLAEINSKIDEIRKISNLAKKSGHSEVDKLYKSLMSIVGKRLDNDINNISSNKEGLKELTEIHSEIKGYYNKWVESYNSLQKIVSTINGYKHTDVLNKIELGLQIFNQLKQRYGVSYNYDDAKLKSDADVLNNLVDKLDKSYKSSLTDGLKILGQFHNIMGSITSSTDSVRNLLLKYDTAKQRVDNWSKIINTALAEMNQYKKWSKSGESAEIDNKVKSYSLESGEKSDLIKLNSKLDVLLSDIDYMRMKWKRRKDEEEEEIRRKKRAEEEARRSSYTSSYSSSSSSSSSSFGGFGGGRSGGGGASGGW